MPVCAFRLFDGVLTFHTQITLGNAYLEDIPDPKLWRLTPVTWIGSGRSHLDDSGSDMDTDSSYTIIKTIVKQKKVPSRRERDRIRYSKDAWSA